ncbi:unnamed protein product [Dovyalis caffra]|uniref:Uncharacterized protein n=1 Tax=Dovyalis caffra TaxID=77055 RepID=A0AAV1RBI3_9ROSI|nr:unnamed protein product [Dovyalis caffra]
MAIDVMKSKQSNWGPHFPLGEGQFVQEAVACIYLYISNLKGGLGHQEFYLVISFGKDTMTLMLSNNLGFFPGDLVAPPKGQVQHA